jgi:hypothetical protein
VWKLRRWRRLAPPGTSAAGWAGRGVDVGTSGPFPIGTLHDLSSNSRYCECAGGRRHRVVIPRSGSIGDAFDDTSRSYAVSTGPQQSGKDPVQRLGCAPLHRLGHVRIQVQGDRDGCVPKHLAGHLRVDAAAQHEGRSRVAQIMEADGREP